MCRHTGRRLEGWDHIAQSLEVLFSTRIGTRVERRAFGSTAKDLLDRPGTNPTILDHYVSIAEAIDLYEPRVELNRFELQSFDENGHGQILVEVTDLTDGQAQSLEVMV